MSMICICQDHADSLDDSQVQSETVCFFPGERFEIVHLARVACCEYIFIFVFIFIKANLRPKNFCLGLAN